MAHVGTGGGGRKDLRGLRYCMLPFWPKPKPRSRKPYTICFGCSLLGTLRTRLGPMRAVSSQAHGLNKFLEEVDAGTCRSRAPTPATGR